jgi:predicted  nucleic acid-binding Zn-ribbon protein
MEVRRAPTAEDLLAGVREGVEEIVRGALEEAAILREEADEKLAQYDALVNELARLRLEIHGLHHEAAEIPIRLQTARLDAMVQNGGGDDADALQARYIAVRERSPVAEDRLSRLDDELASIVAGGSRPSKVSPEGGLRKLVKHTARELGRSEACLELTEQAESTTREERDRLRAHMPMPEAWVTGYEYEHNLQPYHVEVWCEKSTMNDELLPLCERWGVNLINGVGFMSITR